MELRIRDSKAPTGDTRILLVNYDDVVHQLRTELTESAKAKAESAGRAPSLAETRKIERAVKAVPQEIVISERKLKGLASDLELDSLIVHKFFPVLRPQEVHVVQAHMAGGRRWRTTSRAGFATSSCATERADWTRPRFVAT